MFLSKCPNCGAPVDGPKCQYCWSVLCPNVVETSESRLEFNDEIEIVYADNAPIEIATSRRPFRYYRNP